jgi:DNA repair protein RadA/Sms
MAKFTSIYVCQSCASKTPKWQGKCGECGTWNSLVEEVVSKESIKSKAINRAKSFMTSSDEEGFGKVKALHESLKDFEIYGERTSSGFKEIDRVLGGGFARGSLLLFGGEPGIGKSTLLLQILGSLASRGKKVLYISGEESGPQVASRAKRLGIVATDNLQFVSTSDLDEAVAIIEKVKPNLLVADSVQTLSSPDIESAAGTVSQVRAVCQRFMEISKGTGIVSMLVGHVTKEGTVAGPRLLEHMVDGVFYFELATSSGYRLVRGQKNRFGATHEIAVLEMSSRGLLEVDNPSARFLAERSSDMAGSTVAAHLAGSRPFLTEFQALTQKCFQPYPRRTVQGVDQNRIAVLLAVIERGLSISFGDQDVYCKVASGDRIEEPACDLPMLMALVSSVERRAVPADMIFIGEVGLGGELRSVPGIGARLSEAKSVGMKRAVIPAWQLKEAKEVLGIQLIAAKTVKDAYLASWGSIRVNKSAPVNKMDQELDF